MQKSTVMLFAASVVATLPSVLDERVGSPRHEISNTSLTTVLRALRPIVGDAAIRSASTDTTLERLTPSADPPSISRCEPVESGGVRAVAAVAVPIVAAFLDGIQRSRTIGHVRGTPLVFGTVAAVIRQRVERRLTTWQTPRVHRAIFVSRSELGEGMWDQLAASLAANGVPLVDTTEGQPSDAISSHPLAQRARALEAVALEREQAERQLAAQWCAAERNWLWIDGGIAGNLAVDEQAPAFGVVKSHNTLYGDVCSVREVLAMRQGERSSAFLVGHRPRRAVASWYLRLRDSANGDPLHGLVRVEVAPPASGPASGSAAAEALPGTASLRSAWPAFTARADAISSWILAEGAPLSLPDPRWATLTYGVSACEQYLKSIIGS